MTENSPTENPPLNDVSQATNPRLPLERALNYGVKALGLLLVLSLLVWGGWKGMPGLWGALIGIAIGGGFVLFTALSVLFTSNTTPNTTLAVVYGGWLLKVVLLIVVLAFIRDLTFYNTLALFITVVLALIVTLGSEVWAVVTARMSYMS
ncbi:hypothetical protein [Corynebacterium sp.]|uniref:hypothetical protein n=1 Tax=Corynebacterium sp. TaxID=1720 RepID=UPI0026DBFC81|nr:hypothetical protein [Corynebacterium sp.]MDO5033178.1 hypothetical protein [Corynebacterium sp.]